MKKLNEYINEALALGKGIRYQFQPKTTADLKELVKILVRERGRKAYLNDIDTSKITNMDSLFKDIFPLFNGDISKWDVSNVTSMKNMFEQCHNFEGKGLNNWDVSNCENFYSTFAFCDALETDNIEEWGNIIKPSADIQRMFSPKNRKPSWYKEQYK